jgi:RNA polymerase sigma-70 factor (ECF subfamily)
MSGADSPTDAPCKREKRPFSPFLGRISVDFQLHRLKSKPAFLIASAFHVLASGDHGLRIRQALAFQLEARIQVPNKKPPWNNELNSFREYLMAIAVGSIDPELQGHYDIADVVQQTLAEALAGWAQYRGRLPDERRAWLRAILDNVVNQMHRRHRTGGREADREQPRTDMTQLIDPTESVELEFEHEEDTAQLRRAIKGLSPEHQRVVNLRFNELLEWDEIGERMTRSPDAARMLWTRALEELRAHMIDTRDR